MIVACTILLVGCNSPNDNLDQTTIHEHVLNPEFYYLPTGTTQMHTFGWSVTLEEAISMFATDVVVAQFVQHRQFSPNLIEYEFVVVDRIAGNAADVIFIYMDIAKLPIVDPSNFYRRIALPFTVGEEYILALEKIGTPYANTHEDGYIFINNIAISLSNPSDTINNPYFFSDIEIQSLTDVVYSRGDMMAFMYEISRNTPSPRGYIRSFDMAEILNGSQHVVIIEITRPRRLSSEMIMTDWITNDLYYARTLRSLKGDFSYGDELVISFFADTVSTGEIHIVAVQSIEPDGRGNWLSFTSRYSLFAIDQLDEILAILGHVQ